MLCEKFVELSNTLMHWRRWFPTFNLSLARFRAAITFNAYADSSVVSAKTFFSRTLIWTVAEKSPWKFLLSKVVEKTLLQSCIYIFRNDRLQLWGNAKEWLFCKLQHVSHVNADGGIWTTRLIINKQVCHSLLAAAECVLVVIIRNVSKTICVDGFV